MDDGAWEVQPALTPPSINIPSPYILTVIFTARITLGMNIKYNDELQ